MPPFVLLTLAVLGPASDALEPPFRVEAADGPVDVGHGHATPLFHDWDGDGLADLLVGQYAGGRLRVYPNVGTPTAPRFGSFHWFETEAGRASVPIS